MSEVKARFIKFYSLFNYPKVDGQKLGRKTEPVYKAEIKVIDGVAKHLPKKVGEVNIQEKIQEQAKGTTVYEILDRVANGNFDLLDEHDTINADISTLPKDVLEAQEMFSDAKEKFDNVDPGIKATFGQDVGTFLNNFSFDKLDAYIKARIQKEKGEQK